jgi:hypothetical protein
MAALILSACAGSSRTPTSSQSSCAHQGRHALAFAGCMRSHGVPAYRDPQVLLVVHQSTSRVGVAPWRRKATGCRPGPRLIAEVAAVLLFPLRRGTALPTTLALQRAASGSPVGVLVVPDTQPLARR